MTHELRITILVDGVVILAVVLFALLFVWTS